MLLRSMLRRNQLLLFYELAGRLSPPPENHGVIGEKRVMVATTPDERAFLALLEACKRPRRRPRLSPLFTKLLLLFSSFVHEQF
jgi:hypothetical protein